jgi:feruloyl esterase
VTACRRTALLAAALTGFATTPAQAACGDLIELTRGQLTIISARSEGPGAFRPPATPNPAPQPVDLPGFCKVTALVSPEPGSRIAFELWLPEEGWNRRLRMFGNGGYSSALPYSAMARALAAGYAVTATDTGHDGDDPAFAIGRPLAIADWGHRAVHETIVAAKAITHRHYGEPARYSYFEGCSTGGHQAFQEAQRYPGDFDGIVAGAPGHNRTHLNAAFLWQFVQNRTHAAPQATILSPGKLRVLHDHALAQCRGLNGVTAGSTQDSWIADPLACRFDPAVAACLPGKSGADCLTAEEVVAARALYGGTRNPRTGDLIYPPWLPGSEALGPPGFPLPGWSLYWADPVRPDHPARESFWRFWAFGPDWKWQDFDFDRDMAAVDDRLAGTINAMSADLAPFAARGGKLLHYHGLADPVVSPWDSIDYFNRVRALLGEGSASFYRMFLAPGVGHCGGGPGPSGFATQPAIEAWVERGIGPDTLQARGIGPEGRQINRPICPYPAQAVEAVDGYRCVVPRDIPHLPIASAYRR